MNTQLYRSFDAFLKQKYGQKVWKVPVDAGFTCPNRDGLKGTGGCAYCDVGSFTNVEPGDIRRQVLGRIHKLQQRGIEKYIVYFQSYSNTYAPLAVIREKVEAALCHEGIVALYIGTRPDVFSQETARYLASLVDRVDVVVELGLQSAHNTTLESINRGHTVQEFDTAVEIAHAANLSVCAHIILGLPGETADMMNDTVRHVAKLQIEMVKFHHLHIVRNTPLASLWQEGKVPVMTVDEYIAVLAHAIALLPKQTVIARLKGDAGGEYLLSPHWDINKQQFQDKLREYMLKHKLAQGGASE